MLELRNVSFNYYKRGREAIADINCDICPGIHLLLGENGAGKTTLLRVIAGMLPPCSGTVALDGVNTDVRTPSILRRIYCLPDTVELPTRSIREFERVNSRFYPGFSNEEFEKNLADFGLTGSEPFDKLSFGMRRKSMLAYVIALHVDLLLLDEPANGLDINSKKALRNMLARNVGDDSTVIISTHTVSDLKDMFDGVMVLSKGKMLICGLSWEISERVACISGSIPEREALFSEQRSGRFMSLVENREDLQTELDYTLLYSALMSPCREEIIRILVNSKTIQS